MTPTHSVQPSPAPHDLSYTPPSDGDWCYLSHYHGELPAGLKLNNCWGWRFNGSEWLDARDTAAKAAKASRDSLLEQNRRALLRMLNQKIDTLRAPYLPANHLGQQVRERKLSEARSYLHDAAAVDYPYLSSVANARGLSLAAAAQLIIEHAQRSEQCLLESEQQRERLNVRIHAASDNASLEALRDELLQDIYPHLSEKFPITPRHTTPQSLDKALTDSERQHEHTRLRVKLREKINQLRRPWHSDYLLDHALQAQRQQQAQSLLAQAHSNHPPAPQDYPLLRQQAQASGQSLREVALAVLRDYTEQMQCLVRTEALNDSLLREIAKVTRPSEAAALTTLIEEIVGVESAAAGDGFSFNKTAYASRGVFSKEC